MNLTERIISELQKTEVKNIGRLISFMRGEKNFFWVRSGGHDHWTNGTAQHSWRVYQYMRYMWEHPEVVKSDKVRHPSDISNLTETQIILTGLLHDIGKIEGNSHHATKAIKMFYDYLGKGFSQRYPQVVAAIFFHHNIHKDGGSLNAHRDCPLRILLKEADTMAAGTAWNSIRCIEHRSQLHGVYKDPKSNRRNALDRTRQMLSYHMYLDYQYNFHHFKNYALKDIVWNADIDARANCISSTSSDVSKIDGVDFISATHQRWMETQVKQQIVIEIQMDAVLDYTRKLRQDNRNEEELLICSNLLMAFYISKNRDNHKYEYKMRDETVALYQQQSAGKAIVLKDVMIIRDGESKGYRMVAPWLVDVVLIPKR